MVAGETTPGDPDQREQRQQKAEPEFRALERGRPLEIIEVDALGEFLCCACACHVLSLVVQRHHGMNGAEQDQRERKRNVEKQPVMQPVVQQLLAPELPRFVANI